MWSVLATVPKVLRRVLRRSWGGPAEVQLRSCPGYSLDTKSGNTCFRLGV